MDTLDLHDQFEALVAEMDKLRSATTLIDEAASGSRAVLERGEDLLVACKDLMSTAETTVGGASDALREEATAVREVREDVASALDKINDALSRHAERIERTLEEAKEEQSRSQRETGERVQKTVEETSGSLATDMQSAIEALGASQASGFEAMGEHVLRETKSMYMQVAQGLLNRLDQSDKQVGDQVARLGAQSEAVKHEVEAASAWTRKALVGVVVLQVVILVLVVYSVL